MSARDGERQSIRALRANGSARPRNPSTAPAARPSLPAALTRCAAALAALAVALPAGVARADEFHYHDVFIGARATGLAGTMVGLADDPSAAYYNPAGLAHAESETLLLNATAVLGKTLTLKGFLGQDVDLKSTAVLPVASIVTSPFLGGRLAFAGMTTSAEAFRVDQTFVAPEASSGVERARLQRDGFDSTYLAGVAWGVDIERDLDLGVAVYYVFRRYRQASYDERVERAPREDGSLGFERIADENGISHGATLGLGLLYHPGGEHGRLRLGVGVRTGANVSESAIGKQETFLEFADPTADDPSHVRFERQPAVERRDAVSRVPPSIAIGASFRLLPKWLLAADATLHGALEYDTLGRTVTKNSVLNGSIGTEVTPVKELVLRAGAFTNRTSAPPYATTGDFRAPDSFDEYGGTLGLTVARKQSVFILAAKLGFLSGSAFLPVSETASERLAVGGYDLGLTAGGCYFF